MYERFIQLSKVYWLIYVQKVFPELQLQLKRPHDLSSYPCCWRAGGLEQKKSLFRLLVWEWCILAPLHCRLLEKRKYLPEKSKAIHLVFTFSPMKECSGPWKSNGDAAELPAALLFPCQKWQVRPFSNLSGAGVLKPNNMKKRQRSHPENPALHTQSFSQNMPLIFMGSFALYFKKTGAVSLKLDSHSKKYLSSELLGKFFAWSRQSSLLYLSSPLWYHQHG